MGRCHCNVYMRVMTCDCGNRCQGRPTTSASNCCWVRVSAATLLSADFGQKKLPVVGDNYLGRLTTTILAG